MAKDRTARFLRDVEGISLTIALIIFVGGAAAVFANFQIAGPALIAGVGFFLFAIFVAMIGDTIGYWRERLAQHRKEAWAAPEYLGELARVRPELHPAARTIDVTNATPVSLAIFILSHGDRFGVDELATILNNWREEAVKPFLEDGFADGGKES